MTDSVSLVTPDGLVSVAFERPASRSVQRRHDDHVEFVADHVAQLLAASQDGFERYGPGAVVLVRDGAASSWFRKRPFEPQNLYYTTQVHALPMATEADFDGWEARQIETYDPAQEAVAVFIDGDHLRGYRIRGTMPPAEARVVSRLGLN